LKQAGDLHTSTVDQMIAASYMENHDLEKDIEHKREVYRNRRDAMLSALETEMPPGVSFTRPKGGLFLWVELPESLDARRLLARSLEQHVAFVPGEAFFPTSGRKNTLRLNYSNMPEERIIEGVRRLAVAVRKELEVGRTTKEPVSV